MSLRLSSSERTWRGMESHNTSSMMATPPLASEMGVGCLSRIALVRQQLFTTRCISMSSLWICLFPSARWALRDSRSTIWMCFVKIVRRVACVGCAVNTNSTFCSSKASRICFGVNPLAFSILKVSTVSAYLLRPARAAASADSSMRICLSTRFAKSNRRWSARVTVAISSEERPLIWSARVWKTFTSFDWRYSWPILRIF
mmetsp:Transcript_6174/g.12251  ORF Transcript_6174/g.12251 Transcript_6174/m.12251 type:complete len:201 (-) Transcript_6174:536-1138(-)